MTAPHEYAAGTGRLRRVAIARQGLAGPSFSGGLKGALEAVEHLGYVQIDTLAVVERAHHHVLWSRVRGYRQEHLQQLAAEGRIFEYWFHAASYLPMRDYRFALPRMNAIRSGGNRYYAAVDERLMGRILERVRLDGPIRARDLEKDRAGSTGWWNWSASKRALDRLFMQGDLMVQERTGMEKVYDLTERVLPEGVDQREPSTAEFAAYLVDSAIRSHGYVTWKQITHLRTGGALKQALREALEERVADADLIPVAGGYAEPEALEAAPDDEAWATRLLSPFDNLVIHRERLLELFGFDYRLECYVPQPKRRFGYFCLPILFAGRFAGRVDCKAHRRERRLEVSSMHLEDVETDPDALIPALVTELRAFADFNGCAEIEVRTDAPKAILLPLQKLLRAGGQSA
ncbi:MAG TPA: crosslink repair DNA glycosylase YcaQ family protein [Allosphingosinicella sp.]|jgi:hypothetical protein